MKETLLVKRHLKIEVPAPAEEKRIAACLIGELILYLMTSLAKKDLLRPFESLCAFYDQEDQRKKEEKNKEIANIMSDGMMKKDLYYSTIKRSHLNALDLIGSSNGRERKVEVASHQIPMLLPNPKYSSRQTV
ncbi:hypothetical protein I3760_01G181500 [Carya illinoinensis]|nr:hypothetical protein I3760_01G181500 [Carya illinoinensis]